MKYKKNIKRDTYRDDINEEDIYSENSINDLVEWDEISDEEAGFMMGYLDS
mgnify:CR=1 FL=1